MMIKLIPPTDEDDKDFTNDPDTWEMDEAGFAKAKRGNPFGSNPKLPDTLHKDSEPIHGFTTVPKNRFKKPSQ